VRCARGKNHGRPLAETSFAEIWVCADVVRERSRSCLRPAQILAQGEERLGQRLLSTKASNGRQQKSRDARSGGGSCAGDF